jgi:hypothetical protein
MPVDGREIWMRIDIDRHLVNDLENLDSGAAAGGATECSL